MPGDVVAARVVHILAATVWVGGTIFLAAIAVPAARSLPPAERGPLIARLGRGFRPIGWGALAALVVTGLHTMARLGMLSGGYLTGTSEGRLLLAKLVMVAAILALTAAHDLLFRARRSGPAPARAVILVLARTSAALTVAVPVVGVLVAH